MAVTICKFDERINNPSSYKITAVVKSSNGRMVSVSSLALIWDLDASPVSYN